MQTKRPLWQILWMTSASVCLAYYLIKTFILKLQSDTADAFIMMYGLLSVAVYIYFFHSKKNDP